MKNNKEILDHFGKMIIKDCIDPGIGNLTSLRVKENPPIILKEYVDLFKKLDENDFNVLKKYLATSLESMTFNILRIFEENEDYKIVYEENSKQINLVEISEMLKAEPIGQKGWIARFSKVIDKDEVF
ncbi:MAG: hypothetical protein B7Y83_03600 [Flavobacteriales bacterium 32-34-25]|nr:MAG: hypothetical protein B7Y83_03600 [Flavobacteriales bacterium 32-34-25]